MPQGDGELGDCIGEDWLLLDLFKLLLESRFSLNFRWVFPPNDT